MKNKKYKILIIIFLLILFFIASIFFSLLNMSNNNIISKIYINDIDVSKKSKESTFSLLEDLSSKKDKTEVTLEYTTETNEKYETTLDLSILNIDYNIENAVNEAYSIGRSENIFQNNIEIVKTLLNSKNISLNISYDEKMLDTIISNITANLPGKLIQSSYYIEDDNLVITKGSKGIVVDSEKFIEELKSIILNLTADQSYIEIPVKEVEPDAIDLDKIHSEVYKEAKDAYYEKEPFKVYADVKGIDFNIEKAQKIITENPDKTEYTISLEYIEPKTKLTDLDVDIFPDLLGTYSTRYTASNKDRTTNLNLAASKIDETILPPGEEFSYNKIVGERSIKAGYKEAKIYVNGKVENGLGGGICQISSTLYNAVVFANLKVTKRYNHQFITSYVPAGRDATVAYGSKDFKFVNNRTYPIKIKVSVNSGVAKVDIYGLKEEQEYEINFDVETISNIPYDTKYETDSSLPAGTEKVKQRGANGIIVNSYKIVSQNGKTISRELISKDKYNALDKVIIKSTE